MVGSSQATAPLPGRIGLAVLAMPLPSGAAAPTPGEYEVKAAFLYNFARFVEWPTQAVAGRPFVIAVYGDDPFGPLLDQTLSGQRVQDQPLELRRIRRVDDAAGVHILFVSASEVDHLPDLFKALEGASVLTVGETDGFAARGGMIGFVVQGKRVRFDVNRAHAARAGLRLSSQLLQVARAVDGKER
jgi:hypothetical protein